MKRAICFFILIGFSIAYLLGCGGGAGVTPDDNLKNDIVGTWLIVSVGSPAEDIRYVSIEKGQESYILRLTGQLATDMGISVLHLREYIDVPDKSIFYKSDETFFQKHVGGNGGNTIHFAELRIYPVDPPDELHLAYPIDEYTSAGGSYFAYKQ
ncbi:MAG: hypothetical protein ABIG42_00720 [bacterium]